VGGDSGPSWQMPESWKPVAASQMLLAKFMAGGRDGQGEITGRSFPGGGGGTPADVNRWRHQVGLPPLVPGDLPQARSSVDVMGGKATLVDVTGKNQETGKDARLIGAIWPRGAETWFFKLMGDPPVAGRERDAFIKFIQSVRFPNG